MFCWLYEHVQGDWKARLTLIFASIIKIVTIRLTNRIIYQEKWKKLRFWKNEAQNQVGIFWQNFFWGAETFFQRPLENFLWTLWSCSRYLKGPLSLVLCVSKTIVTIRYTNEKISAKKRTRNWYVTTSLGMTVNVGGHAVFMGGGAVFVAGRAVLVE